MVPIYSLGKIYLTRLAVISVYIFLSVICDLVSYIFLTMYVGGKWAGNFRHPFRGYFVMVTLEHLKQFHLEVRYCVKVGNVLRR